MSRLENSAKNIFLSLGNSFLSSLLGLASRTVFIYTLGADYLGLAGLLNNVLGFLSISELGIATAIGFSLYKPLAEKNYKSVSALMSVYRKAYSVIGVIVLISGIALFQFLDFFVPAEQQPAGTTFAYFSFLANTVVGYFLSYKTTLISSDNQAFRLVPINVAVNCMQTFLQILVLVVWKNYVIYLTIQIGCSIALMAAQNVYISKKYDMVHFHSKDGLTAAQKQEIKKNISGLIIAKIGDYLVNSTDNLIITKIVSLAATGIYSNYLLIRNIVNGHIGTLFAGVTAGIGNVVAVENDEKKLNVFNTMFFIAFFIYSVEATCFMCLFNPFIGDIWIGEKYLFGTETVAIIVINNYLTGLRMPLITMKGAAGKYLEDAWVPFAFAIVNLVSSILLAKPFGVAGVFLGTIVGSLLTADWYRPIVIYRTVFHSPVRKYYQKYVLYVGLGAIYIALAGWICTWISTGNVYFKFVLKASVAISIPIVLNCILFHRTKEFTSIREIIDRFAKKATIKMKCMFKWEKV